MRNLKKLNLKTFFSQIFITIYLSQFKTLICFLKRRRKEYLHVFIIYILYYYFISLRSSIKWGCLCLYIYFYIFINDKVPRKVLRNQYVSRFLILDLDNQGLTSPGLRSHPNKSAPGIFKGSDMVVELRVQYWKEMFKKSFETYKT